MPEFHTVEVKRCYLGADLRPHYAAYVAGRCDACGDPICVCGRPVWIPVFDAK